LESGARPAESGRADPGEEKTMTEYPARARSGFTLIEMLVVIGIIGLLMGLLFPAIGSLRNAANRARAEQDLGSFEVAIKAYISEYGKYPLQVDATQDRVYMDATYVQLLQILRADPGYTDIDLWNARRVVFMEVAEKAVVAGRLKDPWGNDYRVVADMNFDKATDTSAASGYGVASNRTVAAWSFGKDGVSGANAADRKDDVLSWRD
jgi:prepilin-type N-terminal cleavage/methylation domain-containing protein